MFRSKPILPARVPRRASAAVLVVVAALAALLVLAALPAPRLSAAPVPPTFLRPAGTSGGPYVYSHVAMVGSGKSFKSPSLPTRAGDAVVVLAAIRSAAKLSAVTDSTSDTFVSVAYDSRTDGSSHEGLAIWAAFSAAGGSAVTVTATASTTIRIVLMVVDVTGVGASPIDTLAPFSLGSSTTVTNPITSNASDLVLMAAAVEGGATLAATSGDTLLNSMSLTSGAEDSGGDFGESAASTGTVTMSASLSASHPWIADSLALRAASSSSPSVYPVSFEESGLVNGSLWSVTLNGTTTTVAAPESVVSSLANGSYPFVVAAPAGYTVAPGSGVVTVDGQSVTLGVTFTVIATYPVLFDETGLPNGTPWSVTLNGTTNTTLAPGANALAVPNGSYAFSVGSPSNFTVAPGSGTVTVSGQSVTIAVTYAPVPRFNVTFVPSGLVAATSWSVALNGSTATASAPTPIVFSVRNGTYSYVVLAVPGYGVVPSSGSVGVQGKAVTVGVNFTVVPFYNVTFDETGLITGTAWSVTFNGSAQTAVAPSPNVFVASNGTYGFTVASVAGDTQNVSSGTVTVSGAPAVVATEFRPIPEFAVAFNETGLSNGTDWSVVLNGSEGTASAPSGNLFTVPNGTYGFTVPAVTGYTESPSSGTVTVQGTGAAVAVAFTVQRTTSGPPIQHVVFIEFENAELSKVVSHGPYQDYLSATYGNVAQFYAACHYSLPNYVAITSGRTFGCYNLKVTSVTNLPDLLEGAGLSWAGYFESMPTPCDLTGTPMYALDHNPFLKYGDIVNNATRCTKHLLNSAVFNASVANGNLPTFSFYVPNQDDDCHSTSVAFCDSWLRNFLAPMLNSTNPGVEALVAHTAFFIYYDEGSTNYGYSVPGYVNPWCLNATGQALSTCGGHTYLTVVSPYTVGIDRTNVSPYNVLSTVEWLFGLPGDGGWDGTSAFPAMTSLFSFTSNTAQGPDPLHGTGHGRTTDTKAPTLLGPSVAVRHSRLDRWAAIDRSARAAA